HRQLQAARKSKRVSRHRGTPRSLVSKRVCARASPPARSKHSRADFQMTLNGERVVPHFLSAEAQATLVAMAHSVISKTKMAECFHSDFATPPRTNPRADSHPRCDRAGCRNIPREKTADASRRRYRTGG